VEVVERDLTDPWEGVLATPAPGRPAGLLVLAGSSGRVERERARIFAQQGSTALAIRWFGGSGQPPGICEVPLETFTAAVGLLQDAGARRIGILGVSKGAEAALLTAIVDPRVDVVVALSPTSLAGATSGPAGTEPTGPFARPGPGRAGRCRLSRWTTPAPRPSRPAGALFDYGGTPEADAELGRAAWPHILGARGAGPA
jgi:hypothetical protein